MPMPAPPRRTTLEGEIETVNSRGLRLVGGDGYLNFSKFGDPPPDGLAAGDRVRLTLSPGNDGRPFWVQSVAFLPDVAGANGVASQAPGSAQDEFDFEGLGAEDAGPPAASGGPAVVGLGDLLGEFAADAEARHEAWKARQTTAPAPAPPAGPSAAAPLVRADLESIEELLAQAVDALRDVARECVAQREAIREVGVDLVALFGSRLPTTGLPGDAPGANEAAQLGREPLFGRPPGTRRTGRCRERRGEHARAGALPLVPRGPRRGGAAVLGDGDGPPRRRVGR